MVGREKIRVVECLLFIIYHYYFHFAMLFILLPTAFIMLFNNDTVSL